MVNISSFKDIEGLMELGLETPLCGTNDEGETVLIQRGRTEEGLGRSYHIETFQKNGWSCIHTYWEDGTKEERFKKSDDTKTKVVATSGGEGYFLTDDECFSLFGAIEARLRDMEYTLEEPSAKKDGRYEAALHEIEMLKGIEKKLGF